MRPVEWDMGTVYYDVPIQNDFLLEVHVPLVEQE